jgi:hypothetical protein
MMDLSNSYICTRPGIVHPSNKGDIIMNRQYAFMARILITAISFIAVGNIPFAECNAASSYPISTHKIAREKGDTHEDDVCFNPR